MVVVEMEKKASVELTRTKIMNRSEVTVINIRTTSHGPKLRT